MQRSIATMVCLLGALCLPLAAQNTAGTGTISGVVTDLSGAVVPGASVVVENSAKGIRRELTTTDGGVFSATALVPAPGYRVTVRNPGFARYEVNEIRLEVGQNVNLLAKLQVSSSRTTVEVSTEAPIVDSTKTDVS